MRFIKIYYDWSGQIPYDLTTNNSIDYKPCSKYPITLQQARNRALKALKRAKERN